MSVSGKLRITVLLIAGCVLLLIVAVRTHSVAAIYTVEFYWDSNRDISSVQLQGEPHEGNPLHRIWSQIVRRQIQSQLTVMGRRSGWTKMAGSANIVVLRVIPIAKLRTDFMEIVDPTETELMHAADAGDTPLVDKLLRAEAPVDQRDQQGQTALMHASSHRTCSVRLLGVLLAAGANVNAADRFGQTPLILAARACSPEVVEFLIANGADPEAKDHAGTTALAAARERQDLRVASAIEHAIRQHASR